MGQGGLGRFQVDFRGASLMGGLYRVEEPLSDAEGGMAAVYRGVNTNLGAPVVVKVPDAALLARKGFRERFQQEIEFLKRFDHPNVVRILAAGVHEEVPYLVLAYLGGGTLKQRLARAGGRQAPGEVLTWLRPVATTLDHLHGKGVVHRDVKPGNILFHEVGTPYVSDFGIAKVLEGGASHTATGLRLYTPAYAAPEQMLDDVGGASLDGRADQYALAVTVYEALTGTPPFSGSQSQIEAAKLRDPIPDLASKAPHVDPRAAAAVMRALERDPRRRHASCSAFVAAFEAGMTAGTTESDRRTRSAPPRPSPAPPPRPPGRRKAVLLGVAALAALGLVAYGVLRPGAETAAPAALLALLDEPAEGALLGSREVQVRGRLTGAASEVLVNGHAVPVIDGRFATQVSAATEGDFAIDIGGAARPFHRGVVVDSLPPELEVTEPAEGASVVKEAEALIRGRARDAHLADVRIQGQRVTLAADGTFEQRLAVPLGDSLSVEIQAADRAGHSVALTRTLSREASWKGLLKQAEQALAQADVAAAAGLLDLANEAGAPAKDIAPVLTRAVSAWKADPVIVVLEPADGLEVGAPSVRVRGTLTTGRATDRVLVNDTQVDARSGSFDTTLALAKTGATPIVVRVVDGSTGAARGRPIELQARYRAAWIAFLEGWAKPEGADLDPATGYPTRIRRTADDAEMVLIPAGTFRMGAPARSETTNAVAEESGPERTVQLTHAYYLDVERVSEAGWMRFLRATGRPSATPQNPLFGSRSAAERPATLLAIVDVHAYGAWAGADLPTEAQWERAAKAGHDEYKYPWGSSASGATDEPNDFGVRDMCRTVFELCADHWTPDYHRRTASTDPLGPTSGRNLVIRGGALSCTPFVGEVWARRAADP